jgi:hypothetical protein
MANTIRAKGLQGLLFERGNYVKAPSSLRTTLLAIAPALVVLVFAVRAQAAAKNYTIKTSLSQISVSGTLTSTLAGTEPVMEQAPGSLTTTYSGTIKTDFAAGSIQFLSGTTIDANISGSWTPTATGAAGTSAADYGGRVIFFPGVANVVADFAGRTFISDLLSGSLTVNGSGQFDLSSTALQFTSGAIAYRVPAVPLTGSGSIIGNGGTLTGSGSRTGLYAEKLTIPINTTMLVQIDADTSASLILTGQLVAFAAVPGDFDSDGDVDGADFVAWQTNFPKPTGATLAQGDADADGDVDGADFVVWQTNFPYSGSPGVSPVPEPASGCLSLVGILCLVSCKRRLHASRTAARGL